MRVKLRTTLANAKGCFRSGEFIDSENNGFSKKELKALVDGGYAVCAKQGYETAKAKPAAENAAVTANEDGEGGKKSETGKEGDDENSAKETGGFTLKHVGNGYYDVLDEKGEVATDKPLKKSEAEALIAG